MIKWKKRQENQITWEAAEDNLRFENWSIKTIIPTYFKYSLLICLLRSKLDSRNIVKTSDYLYFNKDKNSANLWKCSCQVPNESSVIDYAK